MKMTAVFGSLTAGRVRISRTSPAVSRASFVGPAPRRLLAPGFQLKGNRYLAQAVQSVELELEGNAADFRPEPSDSVVNSGKRTPAELEREKFQLVGLPRYIFISLNWFLNACLYTWRQVPVCAALERGLLARLQPTYLVQRSEQRGRQISCRSTKCAC